MTRRFILMEFGIQYEETSTWPLLVFESCTYPEFQSAWRYHGGFGGSNKKYLFREWPMVRAWNTVVSQLLGFLTALYLCLTWYLTYSSALLHPPFPVSIFTYITCWTFLIIPHISYPCSLCFNDKIIHAEWYVQGRGRKDRGAPAVIIFADRPQPFHLIWINH